MHFFKILNKPQGPEKERANVLDRERIGDSWLEIGVSEGLRWIPEGKGNSRKWRFSELSQNEESSEGSTCPLHEVKK